MTLARIAAYTLLTLAVFHRIAHADDKPLKVYILAGQSNMEGHARVGVLDYLGDDPQTAPLMAEIKNSDGSHRLIKDTWISFKPVCGEESTVTIVKSSGNSRRSSLLLLL